MALSTAEARADLVALGEISAAEVDAIFASMTRATADDIRDRLLDELPAIGDDLYLQASALAADWYDDLREAAEVKRTFTAITAALPTEERWTSLVRWGVGPLYQAAPSLMDARTLLQGGFQKAVADGHRETIQRSALQDRQATGWARFGNGRTCSFCRLLIGRGAVYSDRTAKFGSHDHCNCIAAPVFESVDTVDGFLSSPAPISDVGTPADTDRAKAWVDSNLPA